VTRSPSIIESTSDGIIQHCISLLDLLKDHIIYIVVTENEYDEAPCNPIYSYAYLPLSFAAALSGWKRKASFLYSARICSCYKVQTCSVLKNKYTTLIINSNSHYFRGHNSTAHKITCGFLRSNRFRTFLTFDIQLELNLCPFKVGQLTHTRDQCNPPSSIFCHPPLNTGEKRLERDCSQWKDQPQTTFSPAHRSVLWILLIRQRKTLPLLTIVMPLRLLLRPPLHNTLHTIDDHLRRPGDMLVVLEYPTMSWKINLVKEHLGI
jgi:hypothetical protein